MAKLEPELLEVLTEHDVEDEIVVGALAKIGCKKVKDLKLMDEDCVDELELSRLYKKKLKMCIEDFKVFGNKQQKEADERKYQALSQEDKDLRLHSAAASGRSSHRAEEVRGLLNAGANPHSLGDDEMTALHVAAYHGNWDAVEMLLMKQANVNLRDNYGETPLEKAGGNDKIVNLLQKHGATE